MERSNPLAQRLIPNARCTNGANDPPCSIHHVGTIKHGSRSGSVFSPPTVSSFPLPLFPLSLFLFAMRKMCCDIRRTKDNVCVTFLRYPRSSADKASGTIALYHEKLQATLCYQIIRFMGSNSFNKTIELRARATYCVRGICGRRCARSYIDVSNYCWAEGGRRIRDGGRGKKNIDPSIYL